jgi:tetratricopeptide (TPR) repeat protein
LGNALGLELLKAEAERAARSTSPDAIDLTMRGRALVEQNMLRPSKDTLIAARALFAQALQIDPNNADALAGEARCYDIEHFNYANPETDYDAKVIGQADRAIALAPDTMDAHWVKSSYLSTSRGFDEAVRAADAGLAINPNYAPLYGPRSTANASLGRFEQAKSDAQLEIRLSPRDPLIGLSHIRLGDAELGLGHLDAAIDNYLNAVDSGFRPFFVYNDLAAAYALEGKMDEAKTALAEARRLNPKLTVKWLNPLRRAFRPFSKASARRGCRKNDRDPEARRDPGCGCRRSGSRGRTRIARSRVSGACAASLHAARRKASPSPPS